jgi:hypothetical protein
MTDELKNLAKAFFGKEDTEKFLYNLEKLKADGSLAPDMYSSMKAEYEQRLNASIREIERLKQDFNRQLAAIHQEQENYQQELTKLEVKHKIGELSDAAYNSSRQKLQTSLSRLKQLNEELNTLIDAESSADLAVLVEKLPTPTPTPTPTPASAPTPARTVRPPLEKVSEKAPEIAKVKGKMSSKKRWAVIGGAVVVVVCVLLVVFLLKPGDLKEVAIPVDVESAANVGSLYFELVYDDNKLTALDVGELVSEGDALIEYNIDTPGRILVAMASSSGINGDMPIVMVRFQVKGGEQNQYKFSLENAVAYDGTSLSKLSVSTEAGDYIPKDKSFLSPRLVFTSSKK